MNKKPPWLKKKFYPFDSVTGIENTLRAKGINTVCQEAGCPNLGECFHNGTATFLILGNTCTRNCRFCAVAKGTPAPLDISEPKNIAQTILDMELKYCVITSVTRDDLPDGGATHFIKIIQEIRKISTDIKIEVLIPDFGGNHAPLCSILDWSPDVLGHNIETVPRLYSKVRPMADYSVSLSVLKRAKEKNPAIFTKSSLMLGMGETRDDVICSMKDLREVGCDLLTIGQYLQPSHKQLPVTRYIPPEEFEMFREIGQEMGFRTVTSGPFVRSSFKAELVFNQICNQ